MKTMIPLKQSHKVGQFGLRIARICIIPLLCMTTGLATEGPVTELAPPLDVRFTAKLDGSEQRYLVRLPKGFDAKQPQNNLKNLKRKTFENREYIIFFAEFFIYFLSDV